jgi:hypothetical protein
MSYDEVALAFLRKAWPDYTIGFEPGGGAWKAKYRADLHAPVLTADSPEELTSLLSDDAARRRRGGVDGG